MLRQFFYKEVFPVKIIIQIQITFVTVLDMPTVGKPNGQYTYLLRGIKMKNINKNCRKVLKKLLFFYR